MSLENVEATTVGGEESVAEQIDEIVDQDADENTDVVEEDEGGEAERVLSEEEEDAEGDADEINDDGYKKNATDRIKELVERSKSAEKELNELKSKFEESQRKQEYAEKPFFELDMTRLENDLAAMTEQVEDLKLEGKILEAAKVQRNISSLLDAVEQNEKAKDKWHADKSERETSEAKAKSKISELDEAAKFYQKEMKIPEDVWDASGLWLKNEMEAKPLLGKKFSETFDRQGAVAAIEWAHQYTLEHMGKESKEAKEKKENAKKSLVGGPSTSSGTSYAGLKTFDDLMKLSSDEIAELEAKNPKLFDKLIKAKLK